MIKRLMLKRTFNSVIIVAMLAVLFGGAYFYTSAKTNISTLSAGAALIKDVLSQKGLLDSFNTAISNLLNLAMLQVVTFVLMTLSLLFLLWFIFRLYLIEEEKALIDHLTGIYNKRAIMLGLKKEVERAEKLGDRLSVAVIDIDYFKQYNDLNGHKAGDNALKRVTKVIDRTIRKTDMLGRFGGEEFVVIFPETAIVNARKICERIRTNVERAIIPFEQSLPRKALTISIGVAEVHDSRKNHRNPDVFDQADKNLYMAKLAGRNCVR